MSEAKTPDELTEISMAVGKEYAVSYTAPPPSTPIAEALVALRDAGAVSVADCRALAGLVGVRTLGDLVVVLGRGEITDEALAEKLKGVLGC